MFRLLVKRGAVQRHPAEFETLKSAVVERNGSDGFVSWVLGCIAAARLDRTAALAHFEEGLGQPLPPNFALDLNAEKAVLLVRYHMFAEARAALHRVPPDLLQTNRYYRRRLEILSSVSAACDNGSNPLFYPESLVDVILEECSPVSASYSPRPAEMVMISGCLGQGGSECQTVTLLQKLGNDLRIKKISLFIRSTYLRIGDDFFVPVVDELGLDLHVYGQDWHGRSDVAEKLPELRSHPRLLRAIDLLPHTFREDLVRLCRLLFDHRPQIVHIWQDIPGAALACIIVGVPRFLIRRGSLSPEYWENNEQQIETQIRPFGTLSALCLVGRGSS